MTQKLAIAISGAVSLGSYEAGVLYEIIQAIEDHNRKSEEKDRILIDVITGASAGAMTAAILAQKLMFDAEALRGIMSNHLYRPWVEDVNILDLIRTRGNDDRRFALLSSDLVKSLAEKYMLQRYMMHTVPGKEKHPAAAERIRLGIALSNLNGIDYSRNVKGFGNYEDPANMNARFTYTRHQDRLERIVDDAADREDFWTEIALAARASGAFPLAFRVLGMNRLWNSKEEYYKKEGADSFANEDGCLFAYTDGGVFQNEPLGMAKHLVNDIDPTGKDTPDRFYLYISPQGRGSCANRSFNEQNATLSSTVLRLIGSIRTQATFQDWVRTADRNRSVSLFNEQVLGLIKAIHAGNASQFDAVTDVLLDALYPNPEDLEARRRRAEVIGKQFAVDLNPIQDVSLKQIVIKAIQVLEKAANIENIDLMKVYTITADKEQLAGDKFHSFLGFFDKSFRDHDYNVGRSKAIEFLSNIKQVPVGSDEDKPLFLRNFTPSPAPEINRSLGQAGFRSISKQVRMDFINLVCEALVEQIHSLDPVWWKKVAIRIVLKPILEGQLKKLLELKDHGGRPGDPE